MFQKDCLKSGEASYLLAYEKKRMKECAGTLQNLASAFLWEEKEEEKEDNRQNLLWKNRIKESRVLLSDHLKEMANIITTVAEERVQMIRLGERKEKHIAKMLFMEGLILEDFYLIEKSGGRKEVVVNIYQGMHTKKNKIYSVEEVGAFLSVLLNTSLVPAPDTPYFVMETPQYMYFEEETVYTMLTGVARAIKENEKVSGDNYSFFEAGDKNFCGVLSDGMGSGEKACEDSEVVVEMVERFLEAGFSHSLCVQMVNDMLLAGGEGKKISTLDMCSVNLYTGEALFLKAGAAYGILKRDSHVEKIPSVSLPLGVFHEVEMSRYEKKLLEGDTVFLFSDGIVDCFPGEDGEKFLKSILMDIPYKNPTEMANYIMKYVIQAGQGRIKDDMTVLVMSIWENHVKD